MQRHGKSAAEIFQNFSLGFQIKYVFTLGALAILSFIFGKFNSISPLLFLALIAPMVIKLNFYFMAKIIKYKIVEPDIVVVAFSRIVLVKFSIKDITRVDDANLFFANPLTRFKQGHTRFYRFRNSFRDAGKLIKLKNGRTIVITPESGSELDLLLRNIGKKGMIPF